MCYLLSTVDSFYDTDNCNIDSHEDLAVFNNFADARFVAQQFIAKWLTDKQLTIHSMSMDDCGVVHMRYSRNFIREKDNNPYEVHHKIVMYIRKLTDENKLEWEYNH